MMTFLLHFLTSFYKNYINNIILQAFEYLKFHVIFYTINKENIELIIYLILFLVNLLEKIINSLQIY